MTMSVCLSPVKVKEGSDYHQPIQTDIDNFLPKVQFFNPFMTSTPKKNITGRAQPEVTDDAQVFLLPAFADDSIDDFPRATSHPVIQTQSQILNMKMHTVRRVITAKRREVGHGLPYEKFMDVKCNRNPKNIETYNILPTLSIQKREEKLFENMQKCDNDKVEDLCDLYQDEAAKIKQNQTRDLTLRSGVQKWYEDAVVNHYTIQHHKLITQAEKQLSELNPALMDGVIQQDESSEKKFSQKRFSQFNLKPRETRPTRSFRQLLGDRGSKRRYDELCASNTKRQCFE